MKKCMIISLVALSLAFMLAAMPIVALGDDKADLLRVVADPVVQQRVLNAAKRSSVVINDSCPSAQFNLTDNLVIYKPLLRDTAGALIGGAWKQIVQENGCGNSRYLNVLAYVKDPKTLVTAPLLPGTTHADPILQKDAVRYAVIAAGAAMKNCNTAYIANTEFLQQEGEALKDAKGPAWREMWTVITCTNKAIVPLQFIPDSTGTEIVASPSETKNFPLESSGQEVCDFFQTYRNNPNAPELRNLNAEHVLGKLCDPKYPATCKSENISLSRLDEMGISKNDEVLKGLLDDHWTIWVSTVDIDNEAVDEIRLFSIVGTAHCTRSFFYKQDATGRFHLMSDRRKEKRKREDRKSEEGREEVRSYEVFREEGRFCGGGGLSFVHYKGKVYVLESEVYETAPTEWLDTVWLGSGSQLKELCTYKHPE